MWKESFIFFFLPRILSTGHGNTRKEPWFCQQFYSASLQHIAAFAQCMFFIHQLSCTLSILDRTEQNTNAVPFLQKTDGFSLLPIWLNVWANCFWKLLMKNTSRVYLICVKVRAVISFVFVLFCFFNQKGDIMNSMAFFLKMSNWISCGYLWCHTVSYPQSHSVPLEHGAKILTQAAQHRMNYHYNSFGWASPQTLFWPSILIGDTQKAKQSVEGENKSNTMWVSM